MQPFFRILSLITVISAVGCGSETSVPLSGNTPATTIAQELKVDTSSPETALEGFLDALRTGDDVQARLVLTSKAQQETEKHDLAVAPQGSSTAKFGLGETNYVGREGRLAHVTSWWTDLDQDSQPFRYDIVWVLKQETPGWRVSGLSTRLFEGGNPVLLDFEDPAEMERNTLAARQELMEHMQRTRQANQPQVPNGTQRR